ncbi:SIS domain-containing protein [Ruegeria profundi]|uniref:SIS domain-containing protein n=1 Tax=Ruegeria profundi TaxID=1685378 RepID=UPI001CD78C09|nr:SIS domain-containing protein [Ruegeria profundi]MCA0929072.1 SIS domain-containing protein [Ruegeria profundi]
MSQNSSKMRQEILEIPDAVDRLLSQGAANIHTAVDLMKGADPRFLITVARGSSDHACTYLKYASELLLNLPVASVGPSVNSIYGVDLRADGAVCLSVSQSGQSPDIVGMTRSLKSSGGLTVAITNNTTSRLAEVADAVLPLHAGPELSVAATKTFVTSLVAGLWVLAEVKGDGELIAAIRSLPAHLAQAAQCDWSAAATSITGRSLFTLGRGPSFAMSNEAALKIKETCQIHAESYSAAEVLHGPVSIVEEGFPTIVFAAADAAEQATAEAADALAGKGAAVFAATDKVTKAESLPVIRTGHWLTDPIANITSFYSMVEAVALARGIDPDAPRHLRKVTETV